MEEIARIRVAKIIEGAISGSIPEADAARLVEVVTAQHPADSMIADAYHALVHYVKIETFESRTVNTPSGR